MDNINGGELESERVLCPRIELLGKFDLRKKKNIGEERRYAWVMMHEDGAKEGGRQMCEGNGTHDVGGNLALRVLLVSFDRHDLFRNSVQCDVARDSCHRSRLGGGFLHSCRFRRGGGWPRTCRRRQRGAEELAVELAVETLTRFDCSSTGLAGFFFQDVNRSRDFLSGEGGCDITFW